MLTNRLEHGQFAWPSASTTGRITLSASQLASRPPLSRARAGGLVVRRARAMTGRDDIADAPIAGRHQAVRQNAARYGKRPERSEAPANGHC